MKEVSITPTSTTVEFMCNTSPDMVNGVETTELTTRDMFSWLLFNSENMNAISNSVESTETAPILSSHHQPLDDIEDPFRMLPPDNTTLPSLSMDPIEVVQPITTVQHKSVNPSIKSNTPLPSGRGIKRSGSDLQSTPESISIGDYATSMATATEGLLRHLQTVNNTLFGEETEAIKMEGSGSSGSETTSDRQRKLKLERNRESARECRRRKREHILGVEERCRQLERENMELRGQLKAGKEAMQQEEREKNRACEELERMIARGASEKELAEKIETFKEQYSDYGHGRRSALDYHLHQIERLLLPTQVTKMCIWALRQDDSFWQDEDDDTSLPVILGRELGLTEEQKKEIQAQRAPFLAICNNLKSALDNLMELKAQVAEKNVTLDMEMDKLQSILTPTQRAKFIVWVTNNPACMHLLNKLWRSVL